jgi:hypothetical protein
MTEELQQTESQPDDLISSITAGFASLNKEPTINEEQEDDALQQQADEEDTAEDTTEAEEEIDQPKQSGGLPKPKGRRATAEFERAEAERQRADAAEKRLAALEAQIGNLTDIKSLLEPKKEAPKVTIDDELKQYGIDPSKFEEVLNEYGDVELSVTAQKMLKLQDVKQKATLQQTQYQQTINNTAAEIDYAYSYLSKETPELAESLNNGLQEIIDSEAFRIKVANRKMSKNEAQAQAYNNVMGVVANIAAENKIHPALAAGELLNINYEITGKNPPPKKPLQKQKTNGNINTKKANELRAAAGAAPIELAATKTANNDGGLSSSFKQSIASLYE